MHSEETQIRAVVETMTAHFEKADIDGVMSTYAPGAVIMFEPGAPVTDETIQREIFTQMTAANPKVTYYAGHEVYMAEDTAVHIAPWSMKGEAPNGDMMELSGLSVAILRRQPSGAWKMVIDNPYADRLLQR